MRSCLSLNDVDETVTVSLKIDMESLELEMRQLEQAWKDSLLSSPAAHHRCHPNTVCQLLANCASDEATASDSYCRHPCDKTTYDDEPSLVD